MANNGFSSAENIDFISSVSFMGKFSLNTDAISISVPLQYWLSILTIVTMIYCADDQNTNLFILNR